jgi:hypothetical protein
MMRGAFVADLSRGFGAEVLEDPIGGRPGALGPLGLGLFDRRGDVSFCYILAADDAR